MRGYVKPFAITGWLLLSSCSSSPSQHQPIADITPKQVQSLTDLDQLQSLQRSLSSQLAGKDPEKSPKEYALLGDVNQRMVELHIKRLEKVLDSKRISTNGDSSGTVPLPELVQLKQELTGNSSLDPALLPEILAPINREEAGTHNLIKALEAESTNSDLSAERRAMIYHQLYQISGVTKWQEGRDKQMDVIIKAIHAATAKNIFNKNLEDKVDFVRSIYADQPLHIIENMHSVYADMFANRFLSAQAKGNPNAAFEVLQDLTRKQDYEKIKIKMQPVAAKLAENYAAYVTESIDLKWNLAQSFRLYQQEVEVRRILGLRPLPHAKTPEFAQQLSAKFKALESQNPFAALGVLYALEAVEPESEGLEFTLTHQQTLVKNATLQSVSVAKFRSRYEELNYGELIASLITQNLYDSADHDVQVVEPGSGSSDTAADALITGNILEVKVDNSQTRNKKLLQVTVGQNQRPNPAYMSWLELPPKERAKLAKPDETILENKQENVYITSTLHRKVAIFAVSYRLVTTEDKRVIFPDSITMQAEYEDESNEGLEVGELVIPYKVAKLPADSEILHKLAQEVADVIAANLLAILQNQEVEYLKIADKSAVQNNCKQEVENLAKAITLLHTKNSGTNTEKDKIRERLTERTLACF